MYAYLLLREKVIKPLLAGVTRPPGRPPKVLNPLDRHYVNLREELNRTFDTIGLAPHGLQAPLDLRTSLSIHSNRLGVGRQILFQRLFL